MIEPLHGQCLCGACEFTATPVEQEASVCHCGMCRKFSGGINIAVSCAGVVWNDDAPITVYRSSAWAERGFCATCGANLFWRAIESDPESQVIAINAFDTPDVFPVTSQIYIDDKPDCYALAGEITALTGAEVRAMYAPEGGTT